MLAWVSHLTKYSRALVSTRRIVFVGSPMMLGRTDTRSVADWTFLGLSSFAYDCRLEK